MSVLVGGAIVSVPVMQEEEEDDEAEGSEGGQSKAGE